MGDSIGLSTLARHALSAGNATWHARLAREADGDGIWRARKAAEVRDLLALTEIAPVGRLRIEELDVRTSLRALLLLRVPVPVGAPEAGTLGLARHALLGFRYPREALHRALPGTAFVQILAPQGVFHANVARDPVQPLCLGATLPPGVRVTELVLMAYGALSMQAVMLDASDPAGVMNIEAARFWLAHRERLPLSATPFLVGDDVAPVPEAAS
jgi:hypothetical protein